MAPRAGGVEPLPPAPSLEDLRSYVAWMKHTHRELSQRSIAQLAGVHKSSMARLELGQDVTYTTGAAVLRALVEYHRDNLVAPDAPVAEIMTSPVEAAYSTWTIQRLYDELATRGFSWMPFRDKQRSYVGLIARRRVEALLADGEVEPQADVGGVLDALLDELPAPVDHEATVAQVRDRLDQGPPIRLVERFGVVRGVVTPDNLRRVRWDRA